MKLRFLGANRQVTGSRYCLMANGTHVMIDCRPIFVRRAIEAAGFNVKETDTEHMWVPVEIVLAVKRFDICP